MKLHEINLLEEVKLIEPTADMHRWVESATEHIVDYLLQYVNVDLTKVPSGPIDIWTDDVSGPNGEVKRVKLLLKTGMLQAAEYKSGAITVTAPFIYLMNRANSVYMKQVSDQLRRVEMNSEEIDDMQSAAEIAWRDYEIDLEDTLMHELVHEFDPLPDRPFPKNNSGWAMASSMALGGIGAIAGSKLNAPYLGPLVQMIGGFLMYKLSSHNFDKKLAKWRKDGYVKPEDDFAGYVTQQNEKTAWISALAQRVRAMVRRRPGAYKNVDELVDAMLQALPKQLQNALQSEPTDLQQVREFLRTHAIAALSSRTGVESRLNSALGLSEAIDSTNLILYRGAPQYEEQLQHRAFPGVYLTANRNAAAAYGDKISTWRLNHANLLDADSPTAERIVRKFFAEHGREYDDEQRQKRSGPDGKNYFIASQFDIADREDMWCSVFLYPTEKWVKLLRSLGYDGTSNDSDVFLFDISKLTRVQ